MSSARPADLSALLAFAARGRPDAPAVEDTAGRRLTYAELDAAARRIAHRLHDGGVRRGDRVGVCMPKSLASEAAVVAYVAQTKGAIGYVSSAAATAGVKTLEVK